MQQMAESIRLTARTINTILHDPKKTTAIVDLIYVQDSQPGISRIKKGKEFHYFYAGKRVKDEKHLERINKLVIPPAWEKVWICYEANGHLQATGLDARQRKQYKYHNLWNNLRNHTKFYRLREFGKALPSIRQQVKKHLALPGLPVEKVLATVVYLMEQTCIRIGNNAYEKLYGSFGLTTLKDKHVKISGDLLQFTFTGKKGIAHKIDLKSKRLAKIVKNCRDIPCKELFQYYDEEGNSKRIDSGMVNHYLKEITGEDFTAKDFRTWAGTVHALTELLKFEQAASQAEIKRNLIIMLDSVAKHLGNTRSVCKKYYVHPAIIQLYETEKLHIYLKTKPKPSASFSEAELLLLNILAKESSPGISCGN